MMRKNANPSVHNGLGNSYSGIIPVVFALYELNHVIWGCTAMKADGNTVAKTVATSVLTSAAEEVDLIESSSAGGMP